MKLFGLLGKNISYSFSEKYFSKKFTQLGLTDYMYKTFDMQSIRDFETLAFEHRFSGLNVTIPYKESIIPMLDGLSDEAKEIKAINVIAFKDDMLIGHNTDAIGFKQSFMAQLKPQHGKKALILGTGGAAKAIEYVLKHEGFDYQYVSRTEKKGQLQYSDLTEKHIETNKIIINCTPVGTFPAVDAKPVLPYSALTQDHYLYDLVYNPEVTAFMKEGQAKNATTINGLEMLQLQADAAWEIWNEEA